MKTATRALVQHCFSIVKDDLSPDKLYGLVCLTWFSKSESESRPRLTAIRHLLGVELRSLDEIKDSSLPEASKKLLTNGSVGIVNFYRAYRISAHRWIKKNHAAVRTIVLKGAAIESDEDILHVATLLQKLPLIPKGESNIGSMKCDNLLTTLLACLDPTERFPIITGNSAVKALHATLTITHHPLSVKVAALLDLMDRYNIPNSLLLDVTGAKIAEKALPFFEKEGKKIETSVKRIATNLLTRDDEDVEYLVAERSRKMVRLHNTMTNRLLERCHANDLVVLEGRNAMFDALIKGYRNNRNLLIEVKTSTAPAHVRLAIGQLFDYRSSLADGEIDMAILFPEKPAQRYLRLLSSLKIEALWLKGENFFGTIDMAFLE